MNARCIWLPILANLALSFYTYIILSRFLNIPKPGFLPGKLKIMIPTRHFEYKVEYVPYLAHRSGSLVNVTPSTNICGNSYAHLPGLRKD